MLIGKVFQQVEGKEALIAEGIWGAGKHWKAEFPDQSITLYQNSSDYEGISYQHDNDKKIYFKEYQDNGKGWEIVYDSREGIDRMVEYPLPDWVSNPHASVPIHEVEYNNGDVIVNHVGYYR